MIDRNLCFKRIIAFIIDTYVSAIPAYILSVLFKKHITAVYGLFTALLLISCLSLLILRDLIFGGQSIGKRLFGLTVIDNSTYRPAAPSKLIIRNLFFFINMIDGIILITSGLSIGERVTHTMVMHKSDHRISSFSKTPESISPTEKSRTIKTIICVVLAIAILIGALVLVIFSELEKMKNTVEYKLAYTYFIESETFDAFNTDEEKIKFTGYNKEITVTDSARSSNLIFRFVVNGEAYQIVCHENESGWYVCTDCTQVK